MKNLKYYILGILVVLDIILIGIFLAIELYN
jgi:hypothetical protein